MFQNYKADEIDPNTLDENLVPVIKEWSKLKFTRTLYSCAGHALETKEPYILFEVNTQHPLTKNFLSELAWLCDEYEDSLSIPFHVIVTRKHDKHTEKFQYWKDMIYSLEYRMHGRHCGSKELKKLKDLFWPHLTKIIKHYQTLEKWYDRSLATKLSQDN